MYSINVFREVKKLVKIINQIFERYFMEICYRSLDFLKFNAAYYIYVYYYI